MTGVTIKLPFIDIHLSGDEQSRLRDRFTRNPLYRGPCVIINRANGLALDAGPGAAVGGHTCLWQTHAGPWQQWRIKPDGRGVVNIVSESTGLKLTSMAHGANKGEIWLDRKLNSDWSQRWKLTPTSDRVAFRIEIAGSPFAIDSGDSAENGLDPWLWDAHWQPWQQWMIMRLPLT